MPGCVGVEHCINADDLSLDQVIGSEWKSLRQSTMKSKFLWMDSGEKDERIDIGGESSREVSTHSGLLAVIELPPHL